MALFPKIEARPQVVVKFNVLGDKDWGHLFTSFEFRAIINNGYVVKANLSDPSHNLLRDLIEAGYLEKSRSSLLQMKFQIKAGPIVEAPDKATIEQTVNIISLRSSGSTSDKGHLEFIGIDPPSWHLNTGNGSGAVYRGKISDVIRQVINEYAPGIESDISVTSDSAENRWAMMRQTPKTFIASLLEWSSSITQNKTNWIISMDGESISIKEQASIPSRQRAFYKYWVESEHDTIRDWEVLADNALSIMQTKIITQGLSTISGQYLDKITDLQESKVFAKDINTANKKTPKTDEDKSFRKPDDNVSSGPPQTGWTSISSIPEIYSAGDIGLRYDEYIDGRARSIYLNLTSRLMRFKITVPGHGEWSSLNGLGCDTVFIKWLAEEKNEKRIYYLSGNWIAYGFHHFVTRKKWTTDVYLSRFDYDSISTKVGVQ